MEAVVMDTKDLQFRVTLEAARRLHGTVARIRQRPVGHANGLMYWVDAPGLREGAVAATTITGLYNLLARELRQRGETEAAQHLTAVRLAATLDKKEGTMSEGKLLDSVQVAALLGVKSRSVPLRLNQSGALKAVSTKMSKRGKVMPLWRREDVLEYTKTHDHKTHASPRKKVAATTAATSTPAVDKGNKHDQLWAKVDPVLHTRIEKLMRRVNRGSIFDVNKSQVVIAALTKGLEVLEKEYA